MKASAKKKAISTSKKKHISIRRWNISSLTKDREASRIVQKYIHKHIIAFHKREHTKSVLHHRNHYGELVLVGFFGILWFMASSMNFMYAGGDALTENKDFSYPIKQVSTVECRTMYREEMTDNCKIPLPIIKNADYDAYSNSEIHKKIYTTLRAAPYSDSRNQEAGAHNGIDMATARGTPIFSIGYGEVTYAGWQNGYGNVIKIKYIFKGQIFHATYAHLDSIEVKKGDIVSKDQRIGGAGNSGTTFGTMGGYHLHFELDKDNRGKPMYGYLWCKDLDKWHSKIIAQGLCREELFKYSYDPILLLEKNILATADSSPHDHTSVDLPTSIQTEKNADTEWKNAWATGNTTQISESKPATITPPNPLPTTTPTPLPTTNSTLTWNIQTTNVWLALEHFIKQNSLNIESNLPQDGIDKNTSYTIHVTINDKESKPFNGTLPESLSLVTSNSNIKVEPVSVQHVSDGKITFTVTGQKQGTTTLLFQRENQTISKNKVTIK